MTRFNTLVILALAVTTAFYIVSPKISPQTREQFSIRDTSSIDSEDEEIFEEETSFESDDLEPQPSIEKNIARGIASIPDVPNFSNGSPVTIQTSEGDISIDPREFESEKQFQTIVRALKEGNLKESQIESAKNYLSFIYEQEEMELSEELTQW